MCLWGKVKGSFPFLSLQRLHLLHKRIQQGKELDELQHQGSNSPLNIHRRYFIQLMLGKYRVHMPNQIQILNLLHTCSQGSICCLQLTLRSYLVCQHMSLQEHSNIWICLVLKLLPYQHHRDLCKCLQGKGSRIESQLGSSSLENRSSSGI